MATDSKDLGGDSFDPRTWGKGAKDEPAAPEPAPKPAPEAPPPGPASDPGPAAASDSFDPRSWGKAAPTPDPEPEPSGGAAGAPPEASPGPASGPAPSRRGLVFVGLGAAAVAVGAGAWVALGSGRRKVAAATGEGAASTPSAAATATATVQRQVMTLDGPASIQAALSAQGLHPQAAKGAADAAVGALAAGGTTGELRLELATLKPAAGAPPTAEVKLVSLAVRRPDGSGVSVTPQAAPDGSQRFAALVMKSVTHAATQVVRGQVDAESFYTSAVSAGLSDALIPDFFQAFVYDFDFQREIEPGAVFEVAIAGDVTDQGTSVGKRKLLYAAMTTAKKSLALYRYDAPGAGPNDPPWFDGSGRSIKRGLMRTPVEGARISSSFGWRVHPILGFQKLHKGTDFAAPIGTPIYASGDGVVEWAAMKGPNGNLTILKHDNGWETYYLHQNAFAPGIVPGARVKQQQNIGWVGTTGRSTGPHLHYELHINGEAVDAMAQPMDAGQTLSGEALAGFLKQRDAIDKLRASGL